MCPSITAMWLCFLYVLVHNNKCVEQTVLAQTYTNNSAAKNSRFGTVVGAKNFEYIYFFVCARLKRE